MGTIVLGDVSEKNAQRVWSLIKFINLFMKKEPNQMNMDMELEKKEPP